MAGNGAFLERESETNANEPTNPNGLGSPEGGRERAADPPYRKERERESAWEDRGEWHGKRREGGKGKVAHFSGSNDRAHFAKSVEISEVCRLPSLPFPLPPSGSWSSVRCTHSSRLPVAMTRLARLTPALPALLSLSPRFARDRDS